MSERYTRLYALPENLYTKGAPIVVEAGALLKDNNKSRVLAQLKFRNIDDRHIHAVRITIKPEDAFGVALDSVTEYQYLDLDEPRESHFGQNVPVNIPDTNTRAFTVALDEVVFTDGSSWVGPSSVWESLEPAESLADVLKDNELCEQYLIRYGEKARQWPSEQKDLWICTCGAINRIGEPSCCSCGVPLDSLRSFDLNELEKEKNDRLEALAEQRELEAKLAAEKAEKRAEQLKKTKKAAIPVLAAVVAVALLLTLVVIPNVKKSNEYKQAMEYYSAGDYEQARGIFMELGSFKDSEDKVKECDDAIAEAEKEQTYSMVLDALKQRYYPADFRDTLNNLGDYKDSKAILAEYDSFIAAAAAMDTQKSSYLGAEAFAPAVEHMKKAKYVKFSEGTERFLEMFVPFLGKWKYSSGDDKVLSYTGTDASRHKSIKDIEIQYTQSASTGEGTIQVLVEGKHLYISLPKFDAKSVTFVQGNYVGGTFVYSLKDDNTLLVDFKGKGDMPDHLTVEYKRAN